MPSLYRRIGVLSTLTVVAVAGFAEASHSQVHASPHRNGAPLTLTDTAVGTHYPLSSRAVPAALSGSTLAAYRGGAVVIDADSGYLVRIDAAGVKQAELMIGPGAAQLVVDPSRDRAWVTDRRADRIVVVDLSGGQLRTVDEFSTRAEPYGLARTPDGQSLLVTTVADQALTAFDQSTGQPRWELALGPEPRGVAISTEGDEALVTFLTTGAVARVELGSGQPTLSFISLNPGTPSNVVSASPGNPLGVPGKSFVRNAFAVTYVGHHIAVVPHQLSTPHLAVAGDLEGESSGYGGGDGFTTPVNHRLAFLATQGQRHAMANITLHQPRAMAYDSQRDALYVAGFGSDDVLAIADVSQASVHATWQHAVPAQGGACGPGGLAVDPADGHVLVFCALTRQVLRLAGDPARVESPTVVARSAPLAASRLSASARRGRELFRRGNADEISAAGAMACASCHAEVRADGLSWRLQGNNLQTPMLAGRIHEDTAPFKWDGKDLTLRSSLINTVQRLGGTGISPQQARDLAVFLKGVPAPRAPTVEDPTAVARGEALFHSDGVGCVTCHNGPRLTDQQQYALDATFAESDTPSLIGLAHSAPYYHDGSARTLEALLKDNANVHDMGQLAELDDHQVSDLVDYLRTL